MDPHRQYFSSPIRRHGVCDFGQSEKNKNQYEFEGKFAKFRSLDPSQNQRQSK